MGKVFNSLTSEIMSAMKAGEKEKANALKNLKAKLLEFKTSEAGAKIVNANNGEIPDADEITVINKYVKELKGDIETYKTAKPDMAKAAENEMNYLSVFLPKAATAEEVKTVINQYLVENGDFDRKQMGVVVKYVKSHLTNVDGGLVASEINKYLNC